MGKETIIIILLIVAIIFSLVSIVMNFSLFNLKPVQQVNGAAGQEVGQRAVGGAISLSVEDSILALLFQEAVYEDR